MDDEIMKGNFKVKRPISANDLNKEKKESLSDIVRKKALASLGGSMVYVERKKLNWDGNE